MGCCSSDHRIDFSDSYIRGIRRNTLPNALQNEFEQDIEPYKGLEDKCSRYPNLIKGCDALQRLINALTYYHEMNTAGDISDKDEFDKFLLESYRDSLLNDYNHLIQDHRTDIKDIHDIMQNNDKYSQIKCENVNKCKYSMRHNQRQYNQHDSNNSNDDMMNFYRLCMDSLHFYLNHLFEAGLRIKAPLEAAVQGVDCIDHCFSRMVSIIKDSQSVTNNFNRFKCNKKFDFTRNDTDDCDCLFMDAMFKFLMSDSNNFVIGAINKLAHYIAQEEFDTDAIKMDFNQNDGNILNNINAKNVANMLHNFIETNKSMCPNKSTFYSYN